MTVRYYYNPEKDPFFNQVLEEVLLGRISGGKFFLAVAESCSCGMREVSEYL